MITIAVKRHVGVDVDLIATALQEQAWDLNQHWNLGTIKVVAYSIKKPSKAWRIQFYETLPPGMGGIHMNTLTGRVPYAKVLAAEGSVAASHEFCEMLVDPLGTRFTKVGPRNYLVEACDPVERISYRATNGVALSDFILPGWYVAGQADQLDRCEPLGLMPGGYVSWIEGGDWWQAFMDAQGHTSTRRLGVASRRTRRERDQLLAAALD